MTEPSKSRIRSETSAMGIGDSLSFGSLGTMPFTAIGARARIGLGGNTRTWFAAGTTCMAFPCISINASLPFTLICKLFGSAFTFKFILAFASWEFAFWPATRRHAANIADARSNVIRLSLLWPLLLGSSFVNGKVSIVEGQ